MFIYDQIKADRTPDWDEIHKALPALTVIVPVLVASPRRGKSRQLSSGEKVLSFQNNIKVNLLVLLSTWNLKYHLRADRSDHFPGEVKDAPNFSDGCGSNSSVSSMELFVYMFVTQF